MSKYLNRISENADEQKKKQLVLAAKQAKYDLESRISKLTYQETILDSAYEQIISTVPLNINRLIEIKAEMAQVSDEKLILEELLAEEFE